MKKIKLDSEEFIRPVINYMLREYEVDYDYVKKHNDIKGIPWFQYYWDSPESKQEFLDWLKVFLKTNVNYTPYRINDVVKHIDFMYGLIVYDEKPKNKK